MRIAAFAFASALLLAPLAIPVAEARPAPESFADLAESLLPAVVNISTTQTIPARGGPGAERGGPDMPQFPPGSPFEEFFREFMERSRPGQRPGQPAPPRRSQSLGSGFIIDASGYVVTNNHVIADADEINVILQDNTSLRATVVGRDQRTDLALLKVEPTRPLTAVRFGNSDTARVGDWVLAIGNPFGLGGTVTAGIVSARGRSIGQGPYDNFIQTDASINRGNSGGPLFNMAGEVIGINTAIYSPSGGSIGIGFSVPSSMAQNVIAQLREFGRARRGWLGVRIQQVTDELAESVGLREARGAMVAGLNEGGPADKAQIRSGDIILRFNNQDVREMKNLPLIVAETPIGRAVPVVVWRDGREVNLTATVGEMPEDVQAAEAGASGGRGSGAAAAGVVNVPGLGAKLSALTPALREQFQIEEDRKGVVIVELDAEGTLGKLGLRPGDLIVEVQQEAVSTPAEVTDRITRARQQNRRNALMLVEGQNGQRWVPVPLTAESPSQQNQQRQSPANPPSTPPQQNRPNRR